MGLGTVSCKSMIYFDPIGHRGSIDGNKSIACDARLNCRSNINGTRERVPARRRFDKLLCELAVYYRTFFLLIHRSLISLQRAELIQVHFL